jgi:outer membrane protein TolC
VSETSAKPFAFPLRLLRPLLAALLTAKLGLLAPPAAASQPAPEPPTESSAGSPLAGPADLPNDPTGEAGPTVTEAPPADDDGGTEGPPPAAPAPASAPGAPTTDTPPQEAAPSAPAPEATPPAGSTAWSENGAPLLAGLLGRAEVRAPRLVELRSRLDATHHAIDPQFAYPPTMFETRLIDFGFPDWTVGEEMMSMVEVMVRQPLPVRGERMARINLAGAELGRAATALRGERAAVRRTVTEAFAELYAIDRETTTVEAAHELLDLLAATVAARYGAGEGDQAAVLAAQVMTSEHLERLTDLAADRRLVLAELGRLGAIAAGEPAGVVLELPVALPLPEGWQNRAREEAPLVDTARAEVGVARWDVALAEAGLQPAFSVAAGWSWRGSLDGAFTVGLGIELPTDRRSRRQPLVAAARERLRAAEDGVRTAQADIDAEVASLAADWDRYNAEIDLYDQAILPQTSALVDAARASYLAARGELMTVGNAFERWLEARLRRHHLEAERFKVRARVASLLVGDPGFALPEVAADTLPAAPTPRPMSHDGG